MSKPLSVLHFVRRIRAEDGGVVQAVLDLCQTVARRGHRVTLATFDATDVPRNWFTASANVPHTVQLKPSRWFRSRLSPSSVFQFAALAKQADVAHLHTPWEPTNIQLGKLLRSLNVPYIVTTHGMLDDWCMRQKAFKKRLYLALAARKLFQHAATVHFTAEAEREQAAPWIPGSYRPVVQACAMDFALYDKLPGPEVALKAFPAIRNDRKKILFLSRVHPKKGVELLLEAVRILRDRQCPAQALIAGPGEPQYLERLQKLSDQLGLNGDAMFLGMVRGPEKLSLYQLADVFVLPTYQENFGLVLPEAMACASPVVTTRGTDIWREVERGGARIVAHSPAAIAGAVQELLSDELRRQDIGRAGQAFIRQWLNPETVAEGYECMYRDTAATVPAKA